jgi:hypothetical protein
MNKVTDSSQSLQFELSKGNSTYIHRLASIAYDR